MRASILLIAILSNGLLLAQYNALPDWISTPNGHIATGLGLADINGDGYKDLVVANGNDIQRQGLVVYYNQGDGTFPLNPDWQSGDIDYHGHLACGDLDHDGDIDVAVSVYIGETGFSSPGKLKIYYNQGNELESIPSFGSDPFYTFSCAMGDADSDGDLDIAAVAGEPYGGLLDHGKIFLNDNGTFQTTAEWESTIEMGALDVEFGDLNRDGFLDLIFVSEGTPNYIFLANNLGVIDEVPDWESAESLNYINSVDIGYSGNSSIVVMTENDQLGGNGRVRRYDFSDPLPASSIASWYSLPFGYGSGIFLNDVDFDANLDLIYGGWWLPVKIAMGDGAGFELNSSYTSSTASVVEAIQLADLSREDEQVINESFTIASNLNNTYTIVLGKQIVEGIEDVQLNGIVVPPEDYCHIPGKCWISFSFPLNTGDVLTIWYRYSAYPDMVVTNWDSDEGNYIFYNQWWGPGIQEKSADDINSLQIYPNPATEFITIDEPLISGNNNLSQTSGLKLQIYNSQGMAVYSTKTFSESGHIRVDISGLPSGLYLVVTNHSGLLSKGVLMKY